MIKMRPQVTYDVHKVGDLNELYEFLQERGLYLDIQEGAVLGVISDRPGPSYYQKYFKVGEYIFVNSENHKDFFKRKTLDGYEHV